MGKTRWEKKVKSKHKVQNRIKRMKQVYDSPFYPWKITKRWADTGCVCSCPMCSAKNSWNHKSERKKMRDQEKREIEEYYRD